MYKQGDKFLLKNAWKTKFDQDTYMGPYEITDVRNNGTVRARIGKVIDTFNIQNQTPYKEKGAVPIMRPYDIHSCRIGQV